MSQGPGDRSAAGNHDKMAGFQAKSECLSGKGLKEARKSPIRPWTTLRIGPKYRCPLKADTFDKKWLHRIKIQTFHKGCSLGTSSWLDKDSLCIGGQSKKIRIKEIGSTIKEIGHCK